MWGELSVANPCKPIKQNRSDEKCVI